jgi:hypothetical protein
VRWDVLTGRGCVAEVVAPRPAHGGTVEARRALKLASRRRGIGIEHRLVQDLHQNRRTFLVEHPLGQARDQCPTRVPPHHRDAAGIRVQVGAILDGVSQRRFDVRQCGRTKIFGREPVVDRYQQTAGAVRQLHTGRMVGVQVPRHEAAAVGVHHERCRGSRDAAIQTKAQLLVVRTGDGSRFDGDAVDVDRRRPLGGQEVGMFPLGAQRPRAENSTTPSSIAAPRSVGSMRLRACGRVKFVCVIPSDLPVKPSAVLREGP